MKWIKCSDKLPDSYDAHEKHFRLDSKKSTGILVEVDGEKVFEYKHNAKGYITVSDLSRVEWLDESPTTADASTESLVVALDNYVRAQGRMLSYWADGDAEVKNQLWRNLHACEELGRKALEGQKIQPVTADASVLKEALEKIRDHLLGPWQTFDEIEEIVKEALAQYNTQSPLPSSGVNGLVEALKPFADMFGELTEQKVQQGGVVFKYNYCEITVSDLLNASKVLFKYNQSTLPNQSPSSIEESGLKEGEDSSERDELFNKAAELIVANQIGSTSLLQRKMKLGYMRACRIMQQLESAGIVGAVDQNKPRTVLVKTKDELLKIIHH